MHIKTVNLPDGISELVPSSEDEPVESRLHLTDLNLIELNQDPDQCSEEPNANIYLRRQALVHLIPIF